MGLRRFTFLLLLFLALSNIDDINAKRSWFGGSRSSSGSRSSGRTTSHASSSGGRSTSRTSGSGSHTSSGGHKSGSQSQPASVGHVFGSQGHTTSVGHTSSPQGGTSAGTHTSHPTGQSSHQQNKDVSSTFLHAEGGGATRPVAQTGGQGGMNPSAPQNNGRKPDFPTDYNHNSSPYKPSAPPMEHVSKSPSAPPSFGQPGKVDHEAPNYGNAPWSNPHLGQNHNTPPISQPPHIGFKEHVYPQTNAPVNSPYPPTQSRPPYPVTHGNSPYPATPGNPPYPTTHGNPTYPITHNNPYPVTHGNPAYPVTHSNPHYPMTNGNPPPPIGGHPFGYQSNPSSHYPSQVPMSNPYSLHSTGNAYAPGQTFYPQQQQYFAQPAAQPFIPGQTVLMVPGQSDSGRGFGQMLKEALVFSTVNAAVNRVINPHHHYHHTDSTPQGTVVNNTTTIIYNNGVPQETLPGGSYPNGATPPAGSFPIGATSPAGSYPTGGTASGGTFPIGGTSTGGSYPVGGISPAGNYPTGETSPGGSFSTGQNNPNAAATTGSTVSPTSSPNLFNNATNFNAPQYRISDQELLGITELLFAKNTFNASKSITLNLQKRVTSANVTDEAKQPLFYIDPLLLDYPSIYVTRLLYDNYEHDSRKKENRTLERRKEENLLIDSYLNTNVMTTALQWLADRGFIDPDDFERKDILRRIWFSQFVGSSSGFERVFMSEMYPTESGVAILGVQNWLYFEYEESRKRINYLGYVGKIDIGNTATLLKLHFEMDGIIRPNTTIFVGTMPEFEMALYTICYFARPNALCPVSLGGTKFDVYTHSFRYFGNDLIDLVLPIVDTELFK